MFVKQELETPRVKGLCFHPTRTWILVSIHEGDIIIYDYEAGVTLQKYKDTDKPVRSVHFHPNQPLFASGSDDAIIRVYNYEKQRLMFSLNDHLDYVRSVQFHPDKPFLVSASDDQTIRIWNWNTRTCLTSISGHNHYVMSAFFHPTQPYLLSASLDDTVRVWDLTSLFNEGSGASGIFALTDAVIKFQQEDHVSGANWAAWHNTRPLAVSCSDDQSVKLWKVTESEMSIIATLRGHVGNVSSVLFHPTMDIVISCAEDNSVRVWDTKRFIHLAKYKTQEDRFWSLAVHHNQPIFAAGHDKGMIIFRLLRQRPTFDVSGSDVIYYKDCAIRKYNIDSQSDGVVGATKPRALSIRATPLDPPPKLFSYNSAHNSLLVGHSDKFEIHTIGSSSTSEQKCESGKNPVWISRNQYAYIAENENMLMVREINGSSVTKHQIPVTNRIFSAQTGTLYLAGPESFVLYDVMRKSIIATRSISGVRYVFSSPDKKYIALLSLNTVSVLSADLSKSVTTNDGGKIKSGAWYEGFFVYSTKTHIKYILPNGDTGIIRSFSERLYIIAVREKYVLCLTNEIEFRRLDVDLTECKFKQALENGSMDIVMSMIRTSKLCSDSIIDFLQKRGHPEIALMFTKDNQVKFQLAIASGDLSSAVEAATVLNESSIWESLADEAMNRGCFSVAEAAFRKSGNQERLAFFYLISGQGNKLMEMKCDESLQLQRSVWTNNRSNISSIIRDASPALSYIAAVSSGQDVTSTTLSDDVIEGCINYSSGDADVISLPTLSSVEDWPALVVSKPQYDISQNQDITDDEPGAGWGESDEEPENTSKELIESGDEGGWDINDDDQAEVSTLPGTVYAPPVRGESIHQQWISNSRIPGEIAAAGFFGQALNELVTQIALMNPAPLREHFVSCYVAAHSSVSPFANTQMIQIPLSANRGKGLVPAVHFSLERIQTMIQQGYQLTQQGKFAETKDVFVSLLQSIPLCVCSTKAEAKEIEQAISICRSYIIGMVLELTRKETEDPIRQLELAAYFTHCSLDPSHIRLTLQSAMRIAVKANHYPLSSDFAQRLIEMVPAPKVVQAAKKTIATARSDIGKQTPPPKIDYDPRNPFDVCCISLKPIYRGSPKTLCPYCGASFKPEHKGQQCPICQLSRVGGDASGLTLV